MREIQNKLTYWGSPIDTVNEICAKHSTQLQCPNHTPEEGCAKSIHTIAMLQAKRKKGYVVKIFTQRV